MAPPAVLVRIFGGAGLIDRDVETSTFSALGQQGIALRYYGRFGNGRLEEWLPNAHTLQVSEMPAYVDALAQQLGRLHSRFVIPNELKHHHDPIAPPTLWTQLASWLERAHNATFELPDDKDRVSALPLQHLADELTWLQQEVCPKDAKIGFCHNDLLAANILSYDGGDDKKIIQLIDFEYGGMNYLAYDIANHFNEYAGGTDTGTPNYSWFPSIQVRKRFCQAYLQAIGHGGAEDKDVDVLLVEIQGFVLANHLVWGLWAVNQAASEGCKGFDYLQYAACRMNRYFEEKAKWS
jgi:ethanolamine kinase